MKTLKILLLASFLSGIVASSSSFSTPKMTFVMNCDMRMMKPSMARRRRIGDAWL